VDLKVTVSCEVEGSEKTWDLEFSQPTIRIGRHSSNEVQIPDMRVSAEHARILADEELACIIDLGSATGTMVDGRKIGPHRRVPLTSTTEIRIAEYRIVVETLGHQLDETTSEKTAMVAMKMVKEVLGSLSGAEEEPPYIEVLNDDEKGARLDLAAEEGEYVLGREKSCELVLRHWSISRRHARIHRVGETVTAEDLGSKNGLVVNGRRIEPGDLVTIKDGDVIAVGHTEIRFRNPGASLLDSLDASPTPVSDLKDLGLDEKAVERARASTPRSEPPPKAPDRPPPRRPAADESSFADYLPLIFGGILVLGVIAVALWLFVFK
jgi:pSer/pThr/pTyr-binding forkhead associated (FHA) protein